MIKYFLLSIKDLLSFIAVIFFFTNAYPFQDSLYTQIPSTALESDKIVASVGPINITVEEFYNSYEFGPAFVKRKKDSKKRYLNYMINEKLLALDGYSRGVDKNDDVESILSDFENDIATEEMFVEDILSKVEISDDEIHTVKIQKQLELDIRWLYAENDGELNKINDALASGVAFDSLYNLQLKDSIYLDDRSMRINRFQLGKKNSELAEILDTLPVGKFSEPVEAIDGWYIFILDNIMQNAILTESELMRLQQESINALKKKKMDQISDRYVNQLLLTRDPVIKRQCFNVLRSYLGNYILTKELYDEWELSGKLDVALNELQVTKDNVGQSVLVVMNEGNVTLTEFLNWYQNRSQYIKLNKNDL
ncbi:MAG: peptidylprolyl isomerase, partial [Ignavibacteriaceae bacterium]|nr:peptidylprolyl isomerase [Ignavibacteriaceae bacterium]